MKALAWGMAMRWLHFRADEQLIERAQQVAKADRRSLSNWVALTIERAVDAAEAETQHNGTTA